MIIHNVLCALRMVDILYLTVEEHEVKTNIKALVDTLRNLQYMNIETLDNIYKTHMEFDPKI